MRREGWRLIGRSNPGSYATATAAHPEFRYTERIRVLRLARRDAQVSGDLVDRQAGGQLRQQPQFDVVEAGADARRVTPRTQSGREPSRGISGSAHRLPGGDDINERGQHEHRPPIVARRPRVVVTAGSAGPDTAPTDRPDHL